MQFPVIYSFATNLVFKTKPLSTNKIGIRFNLAKNGLLEKKTITISEQSKRSRNSTPETLWFWLQHHRWNDDHSGSIIKTPLNVWNIKIISLPFYQSFCLAEETKGQFHQHFMSSFYARRPQKRKKDWRFDCLCGAFRICLCNGCA